MTPKTTAAASLSTVELCRAAGVSYRQVDYWTRMGFLAPIVEAAGSGTSRRFHPADVARAQVLAAVMTVGPALARVIAVEPAAPWVLEVNGIRITVDFVP